MGVIYQQLGQDEKALERYKRHIRLHPNDVEVLELTADLYKEKKKPYVIPFPVPTGCLGGLLFSRGLIRPVNLFFSLITTSKSALSYMLKIFENQAATDLRQFHYVGHVFACAVGELCRCRGQQHLTRNNTLTRPFFRPGIPT
jgi:tetratricopeptide (TPR) repeat protein